MRIVKRTFEATQHPKGSEERARLNRCWITSEYQPSHRYGLTNDDGTTLPYTYRTKGEAQIRVEHNSTQINSPTK